MLIYSKKAKLYLIYYLGNGDLLYDGNGGDALYLRGTIKPLAQNEEYLSLSSRIRNPL